MLQGSQGIARGSSTDVRGSREATGDPPDFRMLLGLQKGTQCIFLKCHIEKIPLPNTTQARTTRECFWLYPGTPAGPGRSGQNHHWAPLTSSVPLDRSHSANQGECRGMLGPERAGERASLNQLSYHWAESPDDPHQGILGCWRAHRWENLPGLTGSLKQLPRAHVSGD